MLSEGIYLASSISKVTGDQIITSILNTRDEDVTIDRPMVELKKLDSEDCRKENTEEYIGATVLVKDKTVRRRTQEVLEKLRLNHLNSEEREAIEKVCKDYQDIFHVPGEELSCTSVVKHSINVVPGTNPINTKPYRLPETQKAETEKQIDKLVKEGVVEESKSPWNSPLLVVPKKDDASGKKKVEVSRRFSKIKRENRRRRLSTPRHHRNFRPTRTV
jgi:hypothetical protein